MEEKTCTGCRESKALCEFAARSRGGAASACRTCTKAYLAAWHAKNREAVKASSAARYQTNKAGHAVKNAAWREKNKDSIPDYQRAYYAANCEQLKAASGARYAAKGDEIRAKQVARNAAHPEKRRASDGRIRAKRLAAPGSHTAEDIKALMRLQRGLCIACRCDIRLDFHVDHIQALARGGSDDRVNLQLLCPACNRSKHASDAVEFMRRRGFLL